MHQELTEKKTSEGSSLQIFQEFHGAHGAVSAASCSASHRPSEQRYRLERRNDSDGSGAVLRSDCEQPEKNERSTSVSIEIDAAYVAKFASRFRALMERRERRLEEAMSDPQTRTDLEAMFPGMKHGDYQTLLTGVRGMEEEDFQLLLEGARKRRRQVREAVGGVFFWRRSRGAPTVGTLNLGTVESDCCYFSATILHDSLNVMDGVLLAQQVKFLRNHAVQQYRTVLYVVLVLFVSAPSSYLVPHMSPKVVICCWSLADPSALKSSR